MPKDVFFLKKNETVHTILMGPRNQDYQEHIILSEYFTIGEIAEKSHRFFKRFDPENRCMV